MDRPLAVDLSLERARALHRVWRALNDGDCPRCHNMHAATDMLRGLPLTADDEVAVMCPVCNFYVSRNEIVEIERLFAPAMESALAIFEQWRAER